VARSRAGPPPCRGASATEVSSGQARGAEQRSGREEGVRSGGPHLEERGGAWAAPGTRGSTEEKEGAGAGPRELHM
jgi:hypothetical protein